MNKSQEQLNLATVISDYLHTLDITQPLAWYMARGISEAIAQNILENRI